jgi:two-component system sensor histidine kinase YesM
MARVQNAPGIAEMATALSRLLKTVSGGRNDGVSRLTPLRGEIALLDEYMVIQKYRYGDSVRLVKQIADEALLETPIPRFVLQPLVENAIFHGLEPKGGGLITLDVHVDRPHERNAFVVVSISDNGVGMSVEAIAGVQSDGKGDEGEIGLYNVSQRLRYAFGEASGLSIDSIEGSYTSVSMLLPLKTTPPPLGEAGRERE